jgi:hypothetical protein
MTLVGLCLGTLFGHTPANAVCLLGTRDASLKAMVVSAEARWFWRGTPPDDLERWFVQRPIAAGGGTPRLDEYLLDARQQEVGIKRRGAIGEPPDADAIEVKGLVETRLPLPDPFSARVQIWTKWKSPALRFDGLPSIRLRKTRRLRKFDTAGSTVLELALDANEKLVDRAVLLPVLGCHIELVALEVGEVRARWWTLAFEAFGPLNTVEGSLVRTVAAVQPIKSTALSGGLELSYPAWLATEIVR